MGSFVRTEGELYAELSCVHIKQRNCPLQIRFTVKMFWWIIEGLSHHYLNGRLEKNTRGLRYFHIRAPILLNFLQHLRQTGISFVRSTQQISCVGPGQLILHHNKLTCHKWSPEKIIRWKYNEWVNSRLTVKIWQFGYLYNIVQPLISCSSF